MLSHKFKKTIIPTKIIKDRQIIHIDRITDNSLIIRGYVVFSEKMRLKKVVLDGRHPNSNPKTKEFCIPSSLRDRTINSDLILHLERAIKTYNFDDCYFSPWSAIKKRRVYGENRRCIS